MFFTNGNSLLKNGYLAIPMADGKTKPHYPTNGYKQFNRDNFPSNDDLKEWDDEFVGEDTNIILLGDVTPALDFDIEDEVIANKMLAFVKEHFKNHKNLFIRYGTAPKFLIPFSRGDEYNKVATALYETTDNKQLRIEVMGTNASYTYYGKHRKTRRSYKEENIKDKTLLDVPNNKLPKLSRSDIFIIEEYFKSIVPKSARLVSKSTTAKLRQDSKPVKYNADEINTLDELEPLVMQIPFESYDQWLMIGMAIHHMCNTDGGNGNVRGIELWQHYSETNCSDLYDPDEIEDKWLSFDTEVENPVTVEKLISYNEDLINESFHVNKLACTTLMEAIERFYFVGGGKTARVFDSKLSGTKGYMGSVLDPTIEKAVFLDMYSNVLIKKIVTKNNKKVEEVKTLSSRWMASPSRKTLSGLVFAPDRPTIFTINDDDENMTFGNLFVKASFKKTKARNLSSYFIEHIKYLIQEPEEHKWFFQWISWCLQNPGQRCKVTPLLINTDEGSGRGWVRQLLEILHGPWNCSNPTVEKLNSDYQDYMDNKLLVTFEEVHKGAGRYELGDTLKSILDADTMTMNRKYGTMHEARKYCNFFMMSNRTDALPITQSDRRLNIFYSKAEIKPESYYVNLYNMLSNSDFIEQVYSFLIDDVDLSDFNPKGRSMETYGKQLMVQTNKSEAEIIIESFLFHKDANGKTPSIISTYQVYTLLESITSTKYDMKYLKHVITKTRTSVLKQATIDGQPLLVWVFDDRKINPSRELTRTDYMIDSYLNAGKVELFNPTLEKEIEVSKEILPDI